jgi:hypothetical protein
MPETSKMDRNLALEAVRVTEAAALSASRLMGRGDEKAADQAAVDAMREALNSLAIAGTVVIGEGERDEAPMLFIGEKVGSGNGRRSVALDRSWKGLTITRGSRGPTPRRHRHGRCSGLSTPRCLYRTRFRRLAGVARRSGRSRRAAGGVN